MNERMGVIGYRCRECEGWFADREAATPVRASRDRGRAQHWLCPACDQAVRQDGRMRPTSPLLGRRVRC